MLIERPAASRGVNTRSPPRTRGAQSLQGCASSCQPRTRGCRQYRQYGDGRRCASPCSREGLVERPARACAARHHGDARRGGRREWGAEDRRSWSWPLRWCPSERGACRAVRRELIARGAVHHGGVGRAGRGSHALKAVSRTHAFGRECGNTRSAQSVADRLPTRAPSRRIRVASQRWPTSPLMVIIKGAEGVQRAGTRLWREPAPLSGV